VGPKGVRFRSRVKRLRGKGQEEKKKTKRAVQYNRGGRHIKTVIGKGGKIDSNAGTKIDGVW